MYSIPYVNDKIFEGDQFSGFTHNVGKSFTVLLNKNKSSFHILKLVGETFVVYGKSAKTAKVFSLKMFVVYGNSCLSNVHRFICNSA